MRSTKESRYSQHSRGRDSRDSRDNRDSRYDRRDNPVMQHDSSAIDRIDLERNWFNQDTRHNRQDHDDRAYGPINDRKQKGMIGEITGEEIRDEHEIFDQGMPMRSSYTVKKSMHDGNAYFDFNIYKKGGTVPMENIGYFDPSSSGPSNFADIGASMTKMSSQIQPHAVCSVGIEKLCMQLFNMSGQSLYGLSYIINAIGLYSSFAFLYMLSRGATEQDLVKYFDFPKKNDLSKGLHEILDSVKSMRPMLKFANIIVVADDIPFNKNYPNDVDEFASAALISRQYPEQEAARVNNLVNKLMGMKMKRTVIAEHMANAELMILNVGVIRPLWANKFDELRKAKFANADGSISKAVYMYSVAKEYPYFEDSHTKVLEIICIGGGLVMGIILTHDGEYGEINEARVKFYSSNTKNVMMDEVAIPTFTKQIKLRHTGVLQDTGLRTPFTTVVAPEIFPEGGGIYDVVQNITIVVANDGNNIRQKTRGYNNKRKFVANRQFYYYFKLNETDTIIAFGAHSQQD